MSVSFQKYGLFDQYNLLLIFCSLTLHKVEIIAELWIGNINFITLQLTSVVKVTSFFNWFFAFFLLFQWWSYNFKGKWGRTTPNLTTILAVKCMQPSDSKLCFLAMKGSKFLWKKIFTKSPCILVVVKAVQRIDG